MGESRGRAPVGGGGPGWIQNKKFGGGQLGGSGSGWGIRVDVNEELKFFVKIQKKIGGGGGGPGGWVGGSGWM